jgi:biopolymer transport protein ExbB
MLEQMLLWFYQQGGLGAFVRMGGPVLLLVLFAGFLLWLLIFERVIYLMFGLHQDARHCQQVWHERADHASWCATRIRNALLGDLYQRVIGPRQLIRSLIMISPLLGLLGTLTGMMEIFEVMAQTGKTQARAMAEGISRAIIPTLAGMTLALAGLYANALLEAWGKRALHHIRFQLLLQDGDRGEAT